MRIIDLSTTLQRGTLSLVPGHPDFELESIHIHEKDFRANSVLQMSTHTGTHVDAPYHFIREGVTIDELPLEKIVGNAILIDLRNVSAPKKAISLNELKLAVREADIKGKIAILHSGWIKERWGTNEMFGKNPYLTQESADWLVQKRIKSLGLDFALDNPDQSNLPLENRFPIHRTLLGNGIPHIENLCNLELIDQDEFFFVALPLKLHKRDGAPARVIAILDQHVELGSLVSSIC